MGPRTILRLTCSFLRRPALLLAPAPAGDAARRERLHALYALFRPAFEEVPEVDPAACAGLGDVVFVDLRDAAERDVSTLPGAVLPEAVAGLPTDRVVVAFCTLGVRSGSWAAEQRAAGRDVRNLHHGLLGWAHAGGAFVTPEGEPTRRLHTYAARWNLLPEGYEGVW